jgi:hypothetical protein
VTGPALALTVISRQPLWLPGWAGRGPLVAVPAEELADVGLQRGLHQQLGAEPGHILLYRGLLWEFPLGA